MKYSMIPRFSLKLVKEKNIKYPLNNVSSSPAAVEIVQAYLSDLPNEHLIILMLDGRNNFLGISLVSAGGMHGTCSSPRDVLKYAIAGNAAAFIVSHNHPSGDPRPSKEDMVFTRALMQACNIIGIPCVDHIIVSSSFTEGHYSFANEGLMNDLRMELAG